jgi:hypothetical protein
VASTSEVSAMSNEPSGTSPSTFRWRLFPAVAIIAIGALFLANNLGYKLVWLNHGNWWAVIILLAAFAPLTRAWEVYRAHGRFDAEVAYCLLSATAVVLVACMFLLNLDWGTWWPLFVILGGLYTLVPHRHRRRDGYWHRDHDSDDATIKH